MNELLEAKLASWFEELIQKYRLDFVLWQFALSDTELATAELTDLEKRIYRQFTAEQRQESWLKGRNALSQIVQSHERQEICFPNKMVSVSHSGGLALAFKATGFAGVGVDLQEERPFKAGLQTRFLQECELQFTNKLKTLQLWSIKEAVFKANFGNSGTYLKNYQITGFTHESGQAVYRAKSFEFISIAYKNFFYTFAVSLKPGAS
jgi:phosphopantetheinyl transferase